MGNIALKHYAISKDQIASGGPNVRWKIFPAEHIKSQEKVSVFYLQKKHLPRTLQNDQFYSLIRKEASTLLKIRHPHILRILEPLEETRSEFAMVTEPVELSLANILNPHQNLPKERIPFKNPTDCELSNGLRQITEAIHFCHKEAKLLHLNVCPSSVFVTPGKNWKLSGFYFARDLDSASLSLGWDYTQTTEFSGDLAPAIGFSAPEVVFVQEASQKSDAFSLGMVALSLQNHHHFCNMEVETSSFDQYQKLIESLKNGFFSKLPLNQNLKFVLRALLEVNPSERLTADRFLASDYFSGEEIAFFKNLEHLFDLDLEQRIAFLSRISKSLSTFDKEVIEFRILPNLLLQMHEDNVTLFALSPVFQVISGDLDSSVFHRKIFPSLAILICKNKSQKVQQFLLGHIGSLVPLVSQKEFDESIFPFILGCLKKRNILLIISALKAIEQVVDAKAMLFSFVSVETKLLPQIVKLITLPSFDQSALVRVNSLCCLTKLCAEFFSEGILRRAFEGIHKMLAIDKSVAVVMSAASLFSKVSELSGNETNCNLVLPFLFPLITKSTLNVEQKKKIYGVITKCLKKLESSYFHSNDLSEIKSVSEGTSGSSEERILDF